MPRVSSHPAPAAAVAVVSWNTRDLLDACLTSLRPDADAGRIETWVVDNGSADGSADLVRERHPWARLLVLDDNPGFGAAVNAVADSTQTPWIVPSNADVAVEPDAIRQLLSAGEAHPEAGVIAPALVLGDGSTQHSIHPFPTVGNALLVHLGLGRLGGRRLALEGRVALDRGREVDWAHGAFLLVRREAWNAAGGFDPGLWMYAEDLDLCWRVRRAGFGVRYEPAARVRHHVAAATGRAFGAAREDRAQEAAYAWMLRRRGRARTLAFALVGATGSTLRAAVLTLGARLAPGRYTWRRDRARGFARRHRAGVATAARLRKQETI